MQKQIKKTYKKAGMAIEEVVLAVAMVASFASFVIVSSPWENWGSKVQKMVSQLETIERANESFYKKHKVWPHQTTDGDWKRNASALTSIEVMSYPYNRALRTFVTQLNGIETIGEGRNLALKHSYGKGGLIMQHPSAYGDEEYIEVILENVPLKEARKLDVEVDGNYNPDEGRLMITFKNPQDKNVDVHYLANKL